MNVLSEPKRSALIAALEQGLSIRTAAKKSGVSKNTAKLYAKTLGARRCPCGWSAGHQGWCHYRVRHSPARRAFLAGWERGGGFRGRGLPMVWPFAQEDPLVAEINAAVPKTLNELLRQEVCQDMALGVLCGEIQRDGLRDPALISELIRAVYRRYPDTLYTRSLDQPISATDDRTLAQTISDGQDFEAALIARLDEEAS